MLSRYGYAGPGSRVRMYQYLPSLRERGVEIQEAPLLDDEYVENLYRGRKTARSRVIGAYLRRLGQLLGSRRYDLLWIQWELFPWLPALAERCLAGLGIPYLVDFDDAIFHRYDLHSSSWVRRGLGRKIDAVMRHARCVVVGNEYLAERARAAGARRIVELPSVIDLERYRLVDEPASGEFRIGWIGTPVTLPFLEAIAPALARLSQAPEVKVCVVGASSARLPGVNVEFETWSEDTEVASIRRFDVGVMPLSDEPWSRGKCGYKLIQYMACGRAVVASPVGVNARLVEPGANGYLAETQEQWVEALETLRLRPELRAPLGRAGRSKVEQGYSLQAVAPLLYACLRESAR